MRHIVDITDGDDSYAPHVNVGIPPWDHKRLEKHVEGTYLMETRTLAVRDWPEEALREAVILACMYGHPNDYTREKAERHIDGHDLDSVSRAWQQCMNDKNSNRARWYKGYARGFKEAAKQYGLDF